MPIYEYHCPNCAEDFEISQRITDAPLSECPKCHGAVEKLISQSSFVLKGGGWYKTDYGSKNTGGKKAENNSAPACGSSSACASCPSANN